MAVITNKDLDIMCEVEHLLHKKLEQTNGIKDTFKGEEYYYFNENDKEYEIWVKYWNMVERFIAKKKEQAKKQRVWNKNNSEYHRITNNISNNKISGNKEREQYWRNKLKELRVNDNNKESRATHN